MWIMAPGVVLIGDAAGYNDPIIGQGLSMALRDARIVRDLVQGASRAPVDLRAYGEERFERMRRVRLIADVFALTEVEDGADNRAARRAFAGQKMSDLDPDFAPLMVGAFAGPETIPAELVDVGSSSASEVREGPTDPMAEPIPRCRSTEQHGA